MFPPFLLPWKSCSEKQKRMSWVGMEEKKKGREEINFIAKVTWKILVELKTVSS